MRLLSPKEVKSDTFLADKKKEMARIDSLVRQQYENLEKLKIGLALEKQRLEDEFLAFSEDKETQKKALLMEVLNLEKRKKEALKPVSDKIIEITAKEKELQDKENILQAGTKNLEADRGLVTEQMLKVAEKQDELIERELQVTKQEKGAIAQQAFLKKSAEALNEEWADFKQKVVSKELEMLEHEKRNFDKEGELEIIKQSLIKQEQSFADSKKQLDDRQATLQRGFDELKKKEQLWAEHCKM